MSKISPQDKAVEWLQQLQKNNTQQVESQKKDFRKSLAEKEKQESIHQQNKKNKKNTEESKRVKDLKDAKDLKDLENLKENQADVSAFEEESKSDVFSLASTQQNKAYQASLEQKLDESVGKALQQKATDHSESEELEFQERDQDEDVLYHLQGESQKFELLMKDQTMQTEEVQQQQRVEIIEQMVSQISLSRSQEEIRMRLTENLLPDTEILIHQTGPQALEVSFIVGHIENVPWVYQRTQAIREMLESRLKKQVTVKTISAAEEKQSKPRASLSSSTVSRSRI
jgi:hypothetical protein